MCIINTQWDVATQDKGVIEVSKATRDIVPSLISKEDISSF